MLNVATFLKTATEKQIQRYERESWWVTLNTYRTAVSPTLDLLCHEDFNVGLSF